MMRLILLFLVLVQLFASVFSADAPTVLEPSTKRSFPSSLKSLSLAGVGVRVKKLGPVKVNVYAAGLYVDKHTCAAKVKSIKSDLTKNKKFAESKELQSAIIDGTFDKSIVLKMARGVNTETLVNGISDSVRPRMQGKDQESLKKFTDLLLHELKLDGVKSDTVFGFDAIGTSRLAVTINGVKRGTIASSALNKAFVGVYFDEKCVSPTLKSNAAHTIESWRS